MSHLDCLRLLQTIYLGDRACKGFCVDSWESKLLIKVDQISRVRSSSGIWDFYSDEDIHDGYIAFTGLERLTLDPTGLVPNDTIEELNLLPYGGTGSYRFELVAGHMSDGESAIVRMGIWANGIHLIDPVKPGVEIF